MNFRNTFASAIIFTALIGSAQAASLTPKGNHQNWNGASFGFHGGYHFSNITQAGCVGICPDGSDGVDGAFFSVIGAYDYQKPGDNVVIGAYVVVPLFTPDVNLNIGGFNFNVDPQYSIAGGVRFGVTFDDMLAYAFGGYQITMVDVTGPFGGSSANHNGTHFGIGLERVFARNWTMDIRYTFVDVNRELYSLGGGPELFGEQGNIFTIGFNYHLEPR